MTRAKCTAGDQPGNPTPTGSLQPERTGPLQRRRVLRALDLFCGAGGAAMGLHRAGFEVLGLDWKDQPRYPFQFRVADALVYPTEGFDFIWASPICKGHSSLCFYGKNRGRTWPNQIPATRKKLQNSGALWCIENVERAPLETDSFLCGQMFGLPLIRHRLFETNFFWLRPTHRCARRGSTRLPYGSPNRVYTIAGHGYGASRSNRGLTWRKAEGSRALGIDWMIREEMAQAIPPVYSEYIGRFAISALHHIQTQGTAS